MQKSESKSVVVCWDVIELFLLLFIDCSVVDSEEGDVWYKRSAPLRLWSIDHFASGFAAYRRLSPTSKTISFCRMIPAALAYGVRACMCMCVCVCVCVW